jgi:alpha-mannosidase
VTVEAVANAVQTESGSVGQLITQEQVKNIQLNGRNPLYLAQLEPGVVRSNSMAAFAFGLDNGINVNGARSNIQDWGGFIGQWDTRIWKDEPLRGWAISGNHPAWPPANMPEKERRAPSPRYPEDYIGLREGFVKPADVAWYASHHHTADGLNEPYQYSYLFAYAIEVPVNARTLTLPNNDKIRVLAVSVAEENPELSPAQPLYDTLNHTEPPQTSEQATR